MIRKITYIESNSMDPYRNLALEEYLFSQCEADEAILYLWQNRKTVVIGKCQNAWKECCVSKVRRDNAVIARRLSGGGAVFHDIGNLNFTFLVHKENYDLKKQMDVILRAVQKLGIQAEASGRNDILINGRKFSGNAFHEHQGHCYHHGTIMVDVELKDLTEYLNVSQKKLESKGVKSVRSRVVNLIEYNQELNIETLKRVLRETFEEIYGLKSRDISNEEWEQEELKELCTKYASWDWVYGKSLDFQYEISEHFGWGQIDLQFQVENGKITDTQIYSDSMEPARIEQISSCLKGVRYDNQAMAYAIERLQEEGENNSIFSDLGKWIREVEL